MTGERMFSFVSKTWNPIAGGFRWYQSEGKKKIDACPFRCSYCWARILINKFPNGNLGKKYTGPYRIHERAIKQKFKPGACVAVQFMSDVGAPGIPEEVIQRLLEATRAQPEVTFLFMTKNPRFYRSWGPLLPENSIWGTTVETNRLLEYGLTRAPDTAARLDMMDILASNYPDQKLFICIEPIMDFDLDVFVNKIWKVKPWAVAVGYDNYGNKLPEPPQAQTERLIKILEGFTTVYRKNIREAWNK